jgi:nitroreductase
VSFLDIAAKRYSVRGYTDRPVEEDKLAAVLEAGRIAPSACNNQPWVFIVVREEENRRKLAKAYDRPWFAQAPVQIAVCLDHAAAWVRGDGRRFGDVDAAIAMDHIILAATELGLGTCWIGAFDKDKARAALDIPERFEPILLTPLGYPAKPMPEKKRKALNEVVHWERFGGKR